MPRFDALMLQSGQDIRRFAVCFQNKFVKYWAGEFLAHAV